MKLEGDTNYSTMLGNIKRVDAPPYLLTRIQEKVKTHPEIKVGMGWVLAGSMSLVMVLLMNVVIINRNIAKYKKTQNIIVSMNLVADNTLY